MNKIVNKIIPVLSILLMFSCSESNIDRDLESLDTSVRMNCTCDITPLGDLSRCEAFTDIITTGNEIVFNLSEGFIDAGPDCVDITFIPNSCSVTHNYTSSVSTSPQTQIIVELDPCRWLTCGDDILFICFDVQPGCDKLDALLENCLGLDYTYNTSSGTSPPNCIAFQMDCTR